MQGPVLAEHDDADVVAQKVAIGGREGREGDPSQARFGVYSNFAITGGCFGKMHGGEKLSTGRSDLRQTRLRIGTEQGKSADELVEGLGVDFELRYAQIVTTNSEEHIVIDQACEDQGALSGRVCTEKALMSKVLIEGTGVRDRIGRATPGFPGLPCVPNAVILQQRIDEDDVCAPSADLPGAAVGRTAEAFKDVVGIIYGGLRTGEGVGRFSGSAFKKRAPAPVIEFDQDALRFVDVGLYRSGLGQGKIHASLQLKELRTVGGPVCPVFSRTGVVSEVRQDGVCRREGAFRFFKARRLELALAENLEGIGRDLAVAGGEGSFGGKLSDGDGDVG